MNNQLREFLTAAQTLHALPEHVCGMVVYMMGTSCDLFLPLHQTLDLHIRVYKGFTKGTLDLHIISVSFGSWVVVFLGRLRVEVLRVF
jgi:hypothetical protein